MVQMMRKIFKKKEQRETKKQPVRASNIINYQGSMAIGGVLNIEESKQSLLDVKPLVTFDSLPTTLNTIATSNFNRWNNAVASIGLNNSLNQYTDYTLNRLSYQECASLSTDTLINKAITTIINEIFKEGGSFEIKEKDEEFYKEFEEVTKIYDIKETVRTACRKALEYGGSFIYIDTTDEDISQPLYLSQYTVSNTRLKGFKVLEAWQVAPVEVNSFNPLDKNYMKPHQWFVLGAGSSVHYSRLIPLIFFDIPDLLKPIYNYLGLPLAFFMKSFVASAETTRQAISEMLLRFRTDYIKTTAQKITSPDFKERVKFLNQTKNNFGTALLSVDEEVLQINTPLSGLDNILSQMYELVTMTTGMPVTKFLGLSPRGFNATGEHDLNNYYDLITGYQNNIVLPVINKLAQAVSVLKLNEDIKPQFVFNPLNRLTKTEQASINNLNADYLNKLLQAGAITAEDALRAIKTNDYSFKWVEDIDEEQDFNIESIEEMATQDKDIWITVKPNGEGAKGSHVQIDN